MATKASSSDVIGGRRLRLATSATILLLPALACADLDIEPRIELATTYIDNIELVPDDQPKEEEIVGEVYPGLYLLSEGTRHRVELDYTMQALFYSEDSERDQVDHQFLGRAEGTLIEDLFFVEVNGQYAQRLVDPLRPVPSNNLFDVGNLTDVNQFSVMPYLRRDIGQARAEVAYTWARVNYSGRDSAGNELEDTRNNELNASVRALNEEALVTWRAEYEQQEADYDFSAPFEYESLEGELGVRVVRTLRLIAIGGLESDLLDDPEPGGLDEDYWLAGFRWRQEPLGELEMLAGERYFGDAYRFRWERLARVLRMNISYVEEPTTTAQDLALSPIEIVPQAVPEPASDFTTISSEAYLNKAFDATISLIGNRTEIELQAFSEHREYVDSDAEEDVIGGSLRFTRLTGARSEIVFQGDYRESEIRENDPFSEIWGQLGWNFRLTPSLVLGVRAGYQHRSDENGYEATWGTVRIEKTFFGGARTDAPRSRDPFETR